MTWYSSTNPSMHGAGEDKISIPQRGGDHGAASAQPQRAGTEQGVVVQHVKAQSGTLGYDAATGDYVDLLTREIIDPTKKEKVDVACLTA